MKRRNCVDLSRRVGYTSVMESTANLQVRRDEEVRFQAERLARRDAEDAAGIVHWHDEEAPRLGAVCAGCGRRVELRFEGSAIEVDSMGWSRGLPTAWAEPGTFDLHRCEVGRAS